MHLTSNQRALINKNNRKLKIKSCIYMIKKHCLHFQATALVVGCSADHTKSQLLSDPLLSACCSPLQAESASEG